VLAGSNKRIQPSIGGSSQSIQQAPQTAQQNQRKEVVLTDTEKQQFGNRCPEGYKKLRILGK
jgi:hypothetical protein